MLQRLETWRRLSGQWLSRGGSGPQPADDPESPERWRSLDYVHDQIVAQLEIQANLFDSTDARLRLILGVIGIVFAAALGFQRGPTQIPLIAGLLAIGAVCCFLMAGAIVVQAFWPIEFDRPPSPDSLRDELLRLDEREAKLMVIDSLVEAYNRNDERILRKVTAFKIAFTLTALATVLMGFGIMVQVACLTTQPSWWPWPGFRGVEGWRDSVRKYKTGPANRANERLSNLIYMGGLSQSYHHEPPPLHRSDGSIDWRVFFNWLFGREKLHLIDRDAVDPDRERTP